MSGILRKELLGNNPLIPKRSISQAPQIPPRLILKKPSYVASRFNGIIRRIRRLLASFVEIRAMSATEDVHTPRQSAIDQRHSAPAPQLAVQTRKLVVSS